MDRSKDIYMCEIYPSCFKDLGWIHGEVPNIKKVLSFVNFGWNITMFPNQFFLRVPFILGEQHMFNFVFEVSGLKIVEIEWTKLYHVKQIKVMEINSWKD